MKLLICASEYYPNGSGIANVVYNVVEHLKEQGVECTVCSPTGPDVILGSKKLIEKTGIVGLLFYWHKVSQYLKHNDYDVLWVHNPFIFDGSKLEHCLVTMHSTYYGESLRQVGTTIPLRTYKKIASYLERFCLVHMNKNTYFTGVGQNVCDELEKIGIEKERTDYVLNGVNVQQFKTAHDKIILRKQFGIPEDETILLSVGRLTPAKQPMTMLKVFSHIEEKLGEVTLCIAGKGELFEATKELAQKMELRKVLFLGHVDYNRDLPDLYACADYYIMTSKYEGGMPPLTLAEAMSAGLPCIVSDIPNLGIVKDADCGIIVDFDDIAQAGDNILRYLAEEHLDHAKNARSYAVNNLDWEHIAKRYIELFERIENDN